jgi:ATP-dependent protease Clp ATPase subunit
MNDQAELRCSFCEKPPSEVLQTIVGFGGIICDECVQLCVESIANANPDWLEKHRQLISRLPSNSGN